MIISEFDYSLPDDRIARFPPEERDASKLLVWRSQRRQQIGRDATADRSEAMCEEFHGGEISETTFSNIASELPCGSLLVFNNTRVVRARLVMHRAGAGAGAGAEAWSAHGGQGPAQGARIEILCLEPAEPADYERAFAARRSCEWACMVGNSKKWKGGALEIAFEYAGDRHKLLARRDESIGAEQIVRFEWDADLTFGQLLEFLGRMPIPPYLGREGEETDNTRYQTVFARIEGSVAAPTAGLHFTPELISQLDKSGIETEEVTLHVGAGTFLPVKVENALDHTMHTEHFEVRLAAVEHILSKLGKVIAVGTTSVRTLESLTALGRRIARTGDPEPERPVGQFELYDIPAGFDGRTALESLAAWMRTRGLDRLHASTQIMITPAGSGFRVVNGIITNFHQPKSTLLLLIAAFTGGKNWKTIYEYALSHDFRFLSYGDSSLLLR